MKKVVLLPAFLCMALTAQAGLFTLDTPGSISIPDSSGSFVSDSNRTMADTTESFLDSFLAELSFSSQIYSHAVLHIDKTVFNSSDTARKAGGIQVGGAGISFTGIPARDVFQDVTILDPQTIRFSRPLS